MQPDKQIQLGKDDIEITSTEYYALQGSYGGTAEQAGPPLDLCLTVLGLVPGSKPHYYEPMHFGEDVSCEVSDVQATAVVDTMLK